MAGCYIVDDDFMLVTRWLLDDVPADGRSAAGAVQGLPAPRRHRRPSTTRRARRRASS
jgi:hypothetical protein